MKAILIFSLIFILGACQPKSESISMDIEAEKSQIMKVMAIQEDAWNEGNLEGFMEHYIKGDELMFVSSRGINYGWQQALDSYQRSYPDKERMGKLNFDIVYLEVINESAAFMIGKWQLIRELDSPNGHFSLLWRKLDGQWVIFADHSS
jgi:hypothetical protein